MQNREKGNELIEAYGGGQSDPLVAVLKCAAGILILVAIAAGPWLLRVEGGATATEPPASRMVRTFPNSMGESKRIFEERRQRYEARLRASTLAQDGLLDAKAAENLPANR